MTIAVTKSGVAALTDFTNYNVPALDLAGASLLVVGVTWQFGGNALAATYNGVALTPVPGSSVTTAGTGQTTTLFYLNAPPSGSNTLTFLPGPPPSYGFNNGVLDVTYMGFSGTNPSTPFGAVAVIDQGNGTINTPVSLTITGIASTASYIMMHAGWPYGTVASPPTPILPSGMSELQFINDTVTPSTGILFGLPTPTAGSNTLSFENNSGTNFIDMAALEILPQTALTITAAPLVHTATLGAATLVVTGQIVVTAAPLVEAYTLGSATITKPLVITSGPISAAYALGSASASTPVVINPLSLVGTNAQLLGTTGTTYTSTAFDLSGSSLLLVQVDWSGGVFQVTPPVVTYGGQAMTAVAGSYKLNTNSNWARQVYSLAAPPSGSNALVVVGSTGNLMTVNTLSVGIAGSVQGIGALGVVNASSTSVAVPLTGIAGTSSLLVSFVNSDGFGTVSPAFTPAGWTAGANLRNGTSGGDEFIYTRSSPPAGAMTPTFTNSSIVFLVETAFEVLGITAPIVTAVPVTDNYTLGAATIQQALAIGPIGAVTATYALGGANLIVPPIVNAAPATATYALGPITITQDAGGRITAVPIVDTFTLGSAAVLNPQAINAQPLMMTLSLLPATVSVQPPGSITIGAITATYTLNAATVIVPPLVTAAPLVEAYTLGPLTAVLTAPPGAITANAVTDNMTLGAATVQLVKTIGAAPLVLSYSFGLLSVSDGPVITAGALSASYSLGTASVPVPPPQIHATSLQLNYVLGAAVFPATVEAGPSFAAYTLGMATVAVGNPKVISAGPVTATYTLGSLRVLQIENQVITALPIIETATLGAATVTTAFGAVILFSLSKPAPKTAAVQWNTADGTATIANGDYVASSGSLIFQQGSTTGYITVPVVAPAAGEAAKNFKIILSHPVNLSLGINPPPIIVTIPAGTSAVIGELSIADGFLVTIGGSLTITAVPLIHSATLGAASITQVNPNEITYLTAIGSQLYDEQGNKWYPRTVDFYGFESCLVPIGLSDRGYRTVAGLQGVLDAIKAGGFNGMRMGVCEDITWTLTGPPSALNPWTPANGRRPQAGPDTFNAFITPTYNPDFFTSLVGTPYLMPQPLISSLEMLDLIVDYAGQIGLRIILDMHCLAPNSSDTLGNSNGPDANGQYPSKLWYTTPNRLSGGGTTGAIQEQRDETQWIAAWVALAKRYAGNPVVAGFDLINEPAGGTWSTSMSDFNINTDLPSAYERCAAAIQDPAQGNNPDVLIVCEGQGGQSVNGPIVDGQQLFYGTFWSGNLTGVMGRQVGTQNSAGLGQNMPGIQGKVVYSPHEYNSALGDFYPFCPPNWQAQFDWTPSVHPQYSHLWFYDPAYPTNLAAWWRSSWGCVAEPSEGFPLGIAPVWIGELGAQLRVTTGSTTDNVTADTLMFENLDAYLRSINGGFNYFTFNPGTPYSMTSVETDPITGNTLHIIGLPPNAWQTPVIYPMLTDAPSNGQMANMAVTLITSSLGNATVHATGTPQPQLITAVALVHVATLGTASVVRGTPAQTITATAMQATYALGAAGVKGTAITSFLSTSNGKIVDSNGSVVIWKSFNWYGMESNLYPALLSMNGSFSTTTIGRAYKTTTFAGPTQTNGNGITIHTGDTFEGVLDQMKRLGFNCIRIPVSEDITWPNAAVRTHNSDGSLNGVNVNGWLNPDLVTTTDPNSLGSFMQNFIPAIQILDLIIAHCQAIGLYVVLDMHSLAPQDPINGNNSQANGGLWYTTATPSPTVTGTGVTNTHDHIGTNGDPRSELDMKNAWVFLANRYRSTPAVAGFDLCNEAFNGTWDNSATTGLPAFYERMAVAIQDPAQGNNQGALIICEGTKDPITFDSGADPEFPSFAGNLSGVATRPVVPTVPNKVVYSSHEYPQYNTGRFLASNFPASLDRVWQAMWGFIPAATGQSYQAPVWIGEFNGDFRNPAGLDTSGSPSYNSPASQNAASGQWMTEMSAYFVANGISWAYFALNPPFALPSTSQNNYGEAMMDIVNWANTDPNVMAHLTNMLAVPSA